MKPVASLQKTDSLECYFSVANNDSADIPVRKRSADRAKALVETLTNDSIYVKNMFRVANRYWNMGELERYESILNILLSSARLQNKTDKAKALVYLGDYFTKTSRPVKACEEYFKAERLYTLSQDQDGYFSTVIRRLDLYFEYGQFQKCESLAYRNLQLSKANKSYRHAFWNYCALVQKNNGQHEKAIQSFRNAIFNVRYASKKTRGIKGLYFNNLGGLYLSQDQFDKAIACFDNGLKCPYLFPNYSDVEALLTENKNIAFLRSGRGYSIQVNKNAIESGYRFNDYRLLIGCKINQAEYFASVHREEKRLEALKSALQIAQEKKLPYERLKCLSELIRCNAPNLQKHSTDYITLRDSIDSEALKLRAEFSAIEYETSLLKEQNQQLLTQNQKITIGASSVGVLLLGGLFARHHRARKKEVQLLLERQAADDEVFQLLQQQQEKVEEGRKLEKRRISQELHDGVMGKLSGIRLNLFVLNKRSDPETVSKCLGHIDKIQEVEKEIRSIAYDLENDLFGEDRSFSALLRTLVQSAKEVSTTQFHLDLDTSIQWEAIPNMVKIQLYRVLQEALTNIRKYAKAKTVHITLRQRKQHLCVVVTDDGIGFTPSAIKKGLGLTNMETRIRRQGGSFKIKATQGGGTTLVFILPLKS